MMISNKQELRRCLKQAVRRAKVTEERLDFDVTGGEIGPAALMSAAGLPGPGTPFGEDGAAVCAALDALRLPARNIPGAQAIAEEYDRDAWLREVLDAMRARRVCVPVSAEEAGSIAYSDERFAPMIRVDEGCFPVGRYGVNYESAAKRILGAVQTCGARDICAVGLGEEALRYGVLPVCEDGNAVLHIELEDVAQVRTFSRVMDGFPGVRAIASAAGEAERALIAQASQRTNWLVCLSDWGHFEEALERLGTRFLPYAARAAQPELMLGRWIAARERLWQALADAYLPLAKAGYVLDSERIERDVCALLTGSAEALYL